MEAAMKHFTSYEKAHAYIQKHSEFEELQNIVRKNPGPVVTISRETGVGAPAICNKLCEYLNSYSAKYYDHWTYFDKDLINRVLEDHNLPIHFKKFLENEKPHTLDSWFNEMLGVSPSKLALLNKTKQTILHLAHFGCSVIVGRGSNIILKDYPKALHVRLVAPLQFRIETAMKLYEIDHKQAAEFIVKEDEARKMYLLKYFHKDIEDPHLYHAVINTNMLEFDEIAEMIGHCVKRKFERFFVQSHEQIENNYSGR